MVHFLEHPEPQADKIPGGEEESSDELTDVWRESEIVLQARDDAKVDEIIQAHEQDESYDLLACFALAGLVIEHPLFVDEEKQSMGEETRKRQRGEVGPMRQLVQQEIPDVRTPKEHVTRELQFDKLNDVFEQSSFLFFGHVLIFLDCSCVYHTL